MSRPSDLTPAALEGYQSTTGINPYLYSSPNWYAWSMGDWAARHRMPVPSKVAMSRGSRVRVGAGLWQYTANIGWADIN